MTTRQRYALVKRKQYRGDLEKEKERNNLCSGSSRVTKRRVPPPSVHHLLPYLLQQSGPWCVCVCVVCVVCVVRVCVFVCVRGGAGAREEYRAHALARAHTQADTDTPEYESMPVS